VGSFTIGMDPTSTTARSFRRSPADLRMRAGGSFSDADEKDCETSPGRKAEARGQRGPDRFAEDSGRQTDAEARPDRREGAGRESRRA